MHLSILPPLLLALPLAAQMAAQSSVQTSPVPERATSVTIRAHAKLVSVDVVVTDRDHHPVHDLKQQDFAVFENGHPQNINSFTESKATPPAAIKLPAMPRGYFTNDLPRPTSNAVNILLLDALNTPMMDQNYLHQQLLEFLRRSPPGSNTAIFGLSSKLVLLQGFASDPEVLKAALTKRTAQASKQLTDVVGGNSTVDTAGDVDTSMGGVLSATQVASLQTWLDMQESFQTIVRVKDTLDAMNVLARWLATIPGRKNLIWFSGSFPLDILPDATQTSTDPFAQVADAEEEYRETSDMLARAQVAVYPIDVRGLMVSPTSGGAMAGSKGIRTANGRGNAFTNDNTRFFLSTSAEHNTMQRMADDTGGHAFFNTNGLVDAIAHVIDDGSNFYVLSYSPTDSDWNGGFRKIQVKLAEQGYTLAYRHGYYADEPNSVSSPPAAGTAVVASKSDSRLIVKAMAHAVPGSTQVLYKLRVLPTSMAPEDTVAPGNLFNEAKSTDLKPPFRRYSVDFVVVPANITFTATADGMHHTLLAFVTIVYNQDGVLVNRISRVIPATLNQDQFSNILQHGFPYHQEISVPVKGQYSIRTGVHDLKTNRVGTTELPVAAVKDLAPIN